MRVDIIPFDHSQVVPSIFWCRLFHFMCLPSYESQLSGPSCVSRMNLASRILLVFRALSLLLSSVLFARVPHAQVGSSPFPAHPIVYPSILLGLWPPLACAPPRCFGLSLLNRFAQSQARIAHRGSLLELLSSVFVAASGSPPVSIATVAISALLGLPPIFCGEPFFVPHLLVRWFRDCSPVP